MRESKSKQFNRKLVNWTDALLAKIQQGEFNRLWKSVGIVCTEARIDIDEGEAAHLLALDVSQGTFRSIGNIMLMAHRRVAGYHDFEIERNGKPDTSWKRKLCKAVINMVFGMNRLRFIFENEWSGKKPRRVAQYVGGTHCYSLPNWPGGSLGYGAFDSRAPVGFKSADKIWKKFY